MTKPSAGSLPYLCGVFASNNDYSISYNRLGMNEIVKIANLSKSKEAKLKWWFTKLFSNRIDCLPNHSYFFEQKVVNDDITIVKNMSFSTDTNRLYNQIINLKEGDILGAYVEENFDDMGSYDYNDVVIEAILEVWEQTGEILYNCSIGWRDTYTCVLVDFDMLGRNTKKGKEFLDAVAKGRGEDYLMRHYDYFVAN